MYSPTFFSQQLLVCPLLYFLLLLLSVSLLTPPKKTIFCRKRLCTILSLCFAALVSTFPPRSVVCCSGLFAWLCKGKERKLPECLSSQLNLCKEGFSHCSRLFAWLCKEKGEKLLECLSSQLNLCSNGFSPSWLEE